MKGKEHIAPGYFYAPWVPITNTVVVGENISVNESNKMVIEDEIQIAKNILSAFNENTQEYISCLYILINLLQEKIIKDHCS